MIPLPSRKAVETRFLESVADASADKKRSGRDKSGIEVRVIDDTAYAIFDSELRARRAYMRYTMGSPTPEKYRYIEREDGKFIFAMYNLRIEYAD